jgi:hypothetical protein
VSIELYFVIIYGRLFLYDVIDLSDERVLKHIASKNVDYYVCIARRIQAVQGNINPNEERNETKRTDVFDETNLHIK